MRSPYDAVTLPSQREGHLRAATSRLSQRCRFPTTPRRRGFARKYWIFIAPAAIVTALVIVFPWTFTLWMSAHDWKVTGDHAFVGFENYAHLTSDSRFLESIGRTFWFTL